MSITPTPSDQSAPPSKVTKIDAPLVRQARKKEKTPEAHWSEFVIAQEWAVEVDPKTGAKQAYRYNGRFWRPMNHEVVRDEAEAFLKNRFPADYTESRRKSCASLAYSALARAGKVLKEDKDRPLISVMGGVLEVLPDGAIVLHPHDPKLFTKIYVDVDIDCFHLDKDGFYVPEATEVIESRGLLGKYITDAFANVELRRAFQEHLGYSFLPMDSQAVAFVIGDGGQGKGQWGTLLQALHPNFAIADLENLGGFNLESVIGSSVILVDEVGKKIDEAAFKRIFGGGMGVQVGRKFQTSINWVPRVKGFAFVNNMPRFAEHSEGIHRRCIPYPMSKPHHNTAGVIRDIGKKIVDGYKVPVEGKRGEFTKVHHQLKDLLDWALNGAVIVQRRGGLRTADEMPDLVKIQRDELRAQTDPVWGFIEELDIQHDPQGGVTKMEIYQVYVTWCKDRGTVPMSMPNFGSDLKRNVRVRTGAAPKEGKIKVRVKQAGKADAEVWKNAFLLVAKNAADYELRYTDFVWTEEMIAEQEAKQAAAMAAYEKKNAENPPPDDDIVF